jgi:hypothetical protein
MWAQLEGLSGGITPRDQWTAVKIITIETTSYRRRTTHNDITRVSNVAGPS